MAQDKGNASPANDSTRAIAISMGQTITITTIISLVPKSRALPGLSSETITKAGAAGLRTLPLSPPQLAVLIGIWNEATKRTMILSVALVAASLPFTLRMEWLNARKIAVAKSAAEEEEQDGGELSPRVTVEVDENRRDRSDTVSSK